MQTISANRGVMFSDQPLGLYSIGSANVNRLPVFAYSQIAFPDEDDVILLGDLNASEHELGRLGQLPGMTWVVRETTTNTRRSKAYDNILFDGRVTGEYNGRWGVLDLQNTFGLSSRQALEVSDHFPVWAEFGTRETSGQNLPRVPETAPGSVR